MLYYETLKLLKKEEAVEIRYFQEIHRLLMKGEGRLRYWQAAGKFMDGLKGKYTNWDYCYLLHVIGGSTMSDSIRGKFFFDFPEEEDSIATFLLTQKAEAQIP